jgi:hypothetical protein
MAKDKKEEVDLTELEKELRDEYTFDFNGKSKTIRMTYGLQQILCSKFTNLGQLDNLDLDAQLKTDLINEALDSRDENGNREYPDKNYNMYLTRKQGEDLFNWISEHIAYFFISRFVEKSKAQQTINEAIEKIVAQVPMKDSESTPA